MSLEKQHLRTRATTSERTGWFGGFGKWWESWGTSVAAIVAALSVLIGGLWSVTKYVDQRQKETEQRAAESEIQRRQFVGQFAIDLTKKDTRNGAAYAVATLAGKDAVPLLQQYLIESADVKEDASFRAALTQAFIVIGEPSVPPLLQLSRETWAKKAAQTPPGLVLAVSPVLEHLMRAHASIFFASAAPLADVPLIGIDLSYQKLDGVRLSGVIVQGSSFCQATLARADLSNAHFSHPARFGSANLAGADITKTDFGESADFSNANLSGAHGAGARMSNARLTGATFSDTNLPGIDLQHANLQGAQLDNATLQDGNLQSTDLYRAHVRHANMSGADFSSADLEGADLSGADLRGVQGIKDGDTPFLLMKGREEGVLAGANVLGANLKDAKIDPSSQKYLCKYGAQNVPGGCQDVPTTTIPVRRGGGGSISCW